MNEIEDQEINNYFSNGDKIILLIQIFVYLNIFHLILNFSLFSYNIYKNFFNSLNSQTALIQLDSV
jgi:hypothetical protein